MLDLYRIIDTKDKPITTISTGIYIFHISEASYLNIKNPENSIEVIASIYIPQNSYEKIIEDISKYNKYISYLYKLYGIIIGISNEGPQYNQLERKINRKTVEILPDDSLISKVEMITNNKALYQLINNKGDIEIAVKIDIFQNYQSFNL
jgi:predicted AlkP superfamily pyrophosphatase or phosphodiesterase